MRQEARQGGLASLRNPAQMINQEAVQESPEFGDLRPLGAQLSDGVPVLLDKCQRHLLRGGAELARFQVRLQAQFGKQAEFKGEQRLRPRSVRAQVVQQAEHQIEDHGQGRLGFSGLLDERDAVGGLAETGQVLPQRRDAFREG